GCAATPVAARPDGRDRIPLPRGGGRAASSDRRLASRSGRSSRLALDRARRSEIVAVELVYLDRRALRSRIASVTGSATATAAVLERESAPCPRRRLDASGTLSPPNMPHFITDLCIGCG